ncbi:hypothetical protein KTS45_11015 [Halomicroarcula limicola]|uniref:Uncharacterized protein n=1 Tax=Haloarcula limicola TaxID=1429915 RepID=A0A8J7YAK2_9EURY|nr:hypothetical protein [Halomicroarcula limicola]MBV0924729.1 hypothetical protein [Halomicroarcula limicola]
MDFVGDERAQSVQIGAVLLFAVLVVAFSSYQAFVIPEQNREVEFNHNQQVQSQMQDLRNAIVSMSTAGDTRAISIQLGTRYPSRAVAVNPGPAAGSLRTVGTTDPTVKLTISNASASGETGDYWNTTHHYNTGAIRYDPGYNRYTQAPTTVYEHTVLYNRFSGANLTLANQTFINGTDISLVTLNGSLARTSSASTSVDVRSVTVSTQEVRLDDAGSNITISFLSLRSATYWEFLNDTQSTVTDIRSSPTASGLHNVTVELARDETYTLHMMKVGVGTQVTEENTAYLTTSDDGRYSLTQTERTELTLEVRDRFNNPPANVSKTIVYGNASAGRLVSPSQTPDENGEVTFTYVAPSSQTGEQRIHFSYISSDAANASAFDPTTVQNASIVVNISAPVDDEDSDSGGSGAYGVMWLDPTGQSGVACPDGPDGTCTIDASQTADATLTMGTSPVADGAAVQYAVNDTDVGSFTRTTGTTNTSGENETVFSPSNDGGMKVYATSGSSGDTLVLNVINTVDDLIYNMDAVAVDGPDDEGYFSPEVSGGVEFTVTNQFSQSVEITEIRVTRPTGPARALSDNVGALNDEVRRTEVYVSGTANDGHVDINDGVNLPYTFDMDSDGFSNAENPKTSAGNDFTISLFEFRDNRGESVDITGRTFEVTLYYRLDDGTTGSKTITVTPS